MCKRFKSPFAIAIILLTLCAFAAPIFCVSAHAHVLISESASNTDIAQKSQNVTASETRTHHTPTKIGDDCCPFHHCCSAKLFPAVMLEVPSLLIKEGIIYTIGYHSPREVIGNCFDRPPKSLS